MTAHNPLGNILSLPTTFKPSIQYPEGRESGSFNTVVIRRGPAPCHFAISSAPDTTLTLTLTLGRQEVSERGTRCGCRFRAASTLDGSRIV